MQEHGEWSWGEKGRCERASSSDERMGCGSSDYQGTLRMRGEVKEVEEQDEC